MTNVGGWDTAENTSVYRGKRPLPDGTEKQPDEGSYSTSMFQKPRDLGHRAHHDGRAMFQKPREMGQRGTWAQGHGYRFVAWLARETAAPDGADGVRGVRRDYGLWKLRCTTWATNDWTRLDICSDRTWSPA